MSSRREFRPTTESARPGSAQARDEQLDRFERPTRMLVVWCPDWPVVAACAEAGVLPQTPLAVVLANRVLACSATARDRGVRRGMRRREAQGCCPELLVVIADEDRDVRAFEPVAAAVEELAPGVEVVRPGLVAVPAQGPASYFGGEEAAAERLVDQVASVTGAECQVGIADGLFAAVLAAHRGVLVATGRSPEFLAPLPIGELATYTGRLVGRSAPVHYRVDQPGPAGRTGRDSHAGAVRGHAGRGRAVPGGSGRGAVRPGASGGSALGRPNGESAVRLAELIDLLRRLGLRTLGAFAALSEGEVASRFGADAVLAHRLAGGRAQRPPDRRTPPPELVITQVLDPPAERVDMVAFAAKAAAQRLYELLGAHGLACTRLAIEAQTETGEQHSRVWRCADPLTLAGIADRVRWQLDGWLRTTRLSSGVSLIRLWPEEVVDGRSLQLQLFSGGSASAADDERAARAMLRVQSLLGPEGVFTATLDGGRGPAEQITPIAWGDERVARAHPELPWPGRLPRPAPATVAAEPVPVSVFDSSGEPVACTDRHRLTEPPHEVVIGTHVLPVVGWAGPWPVERNPGLTGGGSRVARIQVLLDLTTPTGGELSGDAPSSAKPTSAAARIAAPNRHATNGAASSSAAPSGGELSSAQSASVVPDGAAPNGAALNRHASSRGATGGDAPNGDAAEFPPAALGRAARSAPAAGRAGAESAALRSAGARSVRSGRGAGRMPGRTSAQSLGEGGELGLFDSHSSRAGAVASALRSALPTSGPSGAEQVAPPTSLALLLRCADDQWLVEGIYD